MVALDMAEDDVEQRAERAKECERGNDGKHWSQHRHLFIIQMLSSLHPEAPLLMESDSGDISGR